MKPKNYLIITIALLLASLAFNIYLYTLSRNYYLQLNGLRLDPLGLVYSARNPPPAETDRPQVVFLGDSRAGMWPDPVTDAFDFHNLGLGSQTTEQIALRYDLQIPALQPEILIVQAGINDLKTIPLYPELKARIIQRCKDNLAEIVAKANDAGTTVILTTIFPLGEIPLERRFVWSKEVALAMEEVNDFIYTLESPRVIIFDTGPILAGENGMVQKSYRLDFLHLNPTGYEALNTELTPLLETLVP
ncbi:MAG TPA: SGNH/GDSL hydrolase family protein [Anaerolineales bacterium]|nr:SGNH/GDSL hydrolase family protein [Anaerolineales bacterium]